MDDGEDARALPLPDRELSRGLVGDHLNGASDARPGKLGSLFSSRDLLHAAGVVVGGWYHVSPVKSRDGLADTANLRVSMK